MRQVPPFTLEPPRAATRLGKGWLPVSTQQLSIGDSDTPGACARPERATSVTGKRPDAVGRTEQAVSPQTLRAGQGCRAAQCPLQASQNARANDSAVKWPRLEAGFRCKSALGFPLTPDERVTCVTCVTCATCVTCVSL